MGLPGQRAGAARGAVELNDGPPRPAPPRALQHLEARLPLRAAVFGNKFGQATSVDELHLQ